MDTLEKLHDRVNSENLMYHYKCKTKSVDFNGLIDAKVVFDEVTDDRIKIDQAEKNNEI